MATKYTDLEVAIHTLVTEFRKAADDQPSMNTTQFQTMLSNQLPAVAKTAESEEGLGELMKVMEVPSGQNVSFEHFWKLINCHATKLFGEMSKEKSTKCTCLLQ
ncbi:S100 calcium binding protein V1 isoform 1-T1 [Pholidichthys leucotaenia]